MKKGNSVGLRQIGCLMFLLLIWPISVMGQINIEMVTVGNPGNPGDPIAWPLGSVAYVYQIGKYEVKNSEYAAFLNAKAKTDPYALYRSGWPANTPENGIVRSGSDGQYVYTVKSGYENKPVIGVSYIHAIRFINWMHNGQGNGDTETGAYTITNGGPGSGIIGPRNSGARFFLPTENEWYKVAYYDPTKGTTGGYWLYPMRTDGPIYSAPPPGTGPGLESHV
jgi:formylglycine-generating enzyme